MQEIIGSDICCQILVLHACGGCDTTSAIIGHGKGNVLCKWSNKCSARNCISVMQNPGASVAAVSEAGQRLMVLLYVGTSTDTLSHLHYSHYCKLLLGHQFQAKRLPPSQGAAHNQALRVHLQVIE